jgi:hypothetical protein
VESTSILELLAAHSRLKETSHPMLYQKPTLEEKDCVVLDSSTKVRDCVGHSPHF